MNVRLDKEGLHISTLQQSRRAGDDDGKITGYALHIVKLRRGKECLN